MTTPYDPFGWPLGIMVFIVFGGTGVIYGAFS
jgi:hypothetical protein